MKTELLPLTLASLFLFFILQVDVARLEWCQKLVREGCEVASIQIDSFAYLIVAICFSGGVSMNGCHCLFQ